MSQLSAKQLANLHKMQKLQESQQQTTNAVQNPKQAKPITNNIKMELNKQSQYTSNMELPSARRPLNVTIDNYAQVVKEWKIDEENSKPIEDEIEIKDQENMRKERERLQKLNKYVDRLKNKDVNEIIKIWSDDNDNLKSKISHSDICKNEEIGDSNILKSNISIDANKKHDIGDSVTQENNVKYKSKDIESEESIAGDFLERDKKMFINKNKKNADEAAATKNTKTDEPKPREDKKSETEEPTEIEEDFMYSDCITEEELLVFLYAMAKTYNATPSQIHIILNEKKTFTILELYYVDYETDPPRKLRIFSERQPIGIAEVVENIFDKFMATQKKTKEDDILYIEYNKPN